MRTCAECANLQRDYKVRGRDGEVRYFCLLWHGWNSLDGYCNHYEKQVENHLL